MIRLKPELFADLNGTVEGLRCALQIVHDVFMDVGFPE